MGDLNGHSLTPDICYHEIYFPTLETLLRIAVEKLLNSLVVFLIYHFRNFYDPQ